MGRIGLVLGFERRDQFSEVKVDLGGTNIVTATYYGPPNDDTHPLPGDFAFLTPAPGSGNWVAEGFADPKIMPEAASGERIVYSRLAPGVIAAKVHLKADGSVVINDKVTVTPTGDIEATGEVTAKKGPAQVSLSTHLHPTAMGPTSPPTAGT